jgi:ATP-binding cassette subfamily C protein/ATP-binding cassette subfamily C exporter for protease/lipase/ATP-binding cassette subfamily C protein EexD
MAHIAAKHTGSETSALDATLKECRRALTTVAVFSFVINVLMLATPLYMLQVMDRVLRSGSVQTLELLTLIACGAVLVMSILDTLRSSIAMRTGGWINQQLGPVFLQSSLRGRLRGDSAGSETLRDVAHVQSFVADQGMAAFFDSPWVPIFIFVIWLLHPYLGAIALVSALILFGLSIANEYLTRAQTKTADQAQIDAMRLADITVRNAEVVSAMGMVPAMIARWRAQNTIVVRALQKAGETAGHVLSVTKFVRLAVQIAILGAGAWLVVDNQITTGAMIAAAILLGRALAPVEMAIGGWKGFVSTRIAYRRLQEHIETYPPEPERMRLPIPMGHLEVNGLGLAVGDNNRFILEDISFAVAPGEALAVIGPSGAGKSTLCRLLVSLIDPTTGDVRLDGTKLDHWQSEQLGTLVGFLPQDVELFPGTLRENISRMGPAPDEAVFEAAFGAHAHSMIQRLPDGYETKIGDDGVRLSGGQRQRVGLARAIFGAPRLIVLDEPNANLDQAGEMALAEALKELKRRGCTLIIVGHRPSTVAQADKILVLKDGKQLMFGRRDEVWEAWSRLSAPDSTHDSEAIRRAGNGHSARIKAVDRSIEVSRP